MEFLLDTGVLLRLVNRDDPLHPDVRRAVRGLADQHHALSTTPQNMSEFWNVCTRPASARGGLGLTLDEAHRRLRLVERIVTVLPEAVGTYVEWKKLVLAHGVMGVQVHDARLVAAMNVHGVRRLLSLNKADFARYSGLIVQTPDEVNAAGAAGS